MSPRCLPSGFSSVWLTVCEEMWFEEFKDGHHGSHLGYWNRTILVILNFHNAPMPPIKFKVNQTYSLGADVIWRFSRWQPWWPSWISERNHSSNSKSPCCPMPSTKFPFHLTYCSGADNNWRLSRWLPWQPSGIWFLWRYKKYEKLLTDIQMRDGPWSTAPGELTIEDLQNGCCGGHRHRGYCNKMFLAILNLHVAQMPWIPPSFGSIWLSIREKMRFEIFQHGHLDISDIIPEQFQQFWISISLWCLPLSLCSICITVWEEMSFEEFQDGHLGCQNGMNLAVLNLNVSPMPPTKFQLNPTYH